MRPNGVEARGVDMARVIFTLIHIDTVHVAGRAVVTGTAGALIGSINVYALFIQSTWIVQFVTLIYILANSPVNQDEAGQAQAREGTLIVNTCSLVSATSIIHQTFVHIIALGHAISRITHLTSAVISARKVNAKSI